jgi:puromycin-sensitive aminopeptidase
MQNKIKMKTKNSPRLDSLRSSHPIQVPIPKAEDVDEVFDAISYCKGGSVLRMIYATLGPEKFREGVQLYMKTHQYGNTQTFDLWNTWEQVSGKPIGQMMSGWTDKMGFPLLDCEINQETGELSISQSWFLADNSVEDGDNEKQWMVPILLATNHGEGRGNVMDERFWKLM